VLLHRHGTAAAYTIDGVARTIAAEFKKFEDTTVIRAEELSASHILVFIGFEHRIKSVSVYGSQVHVHVDGQVFQLLFDVDDKVRVRFVP
jgi:hypothetical protein